MLNIEIDGQSLQVTEGSTVMDAANKAGIYIPHFCYHKKLSIAANCRMCLVQVEKAPKPLPACATPVTEGMKVQTHSEQAVKAQKGVMEFLLINHPLDCPICDQGGECQLQDLAVGYGGGESRYEEAKRVVVNKNLGPLISTDMTRCIHCTRCVRFGQEIAGIMELGMAGRGEHSEIMAFVGKTVDSELSGNVIDLCPVGALTSRPFRYSARTWELARRKSVSPHDSLGSNVIVQVKNNKVMRVVPLENEALNECWLSDKDRFSYEGLNADDRLTKPMLKQGGAWKEVEWNVALEFVANRLRDTVAKHGASAIAGLAAPHSTLEEMALLAKLVRGLGSDNVDFRLRQTDFKGDPAATPWLGLKVAELGQLDRTLVIGSFLRKDHPLIAQRLRQSAKRGAQLNLVHAADDELLIKVANKLIVAPSAIEHALAQICVALLEAKQQSVPVALAGVKPSEGARAIAASLASGERKAVLLGNFAQQHPRASQLHALAQAIAEASGATLGFLGEGANSVGGHLQAMFASPRKAYVLLHAEPELDCANPVQARAALDAAELVVVLSPYKQGLDYADVLLPVAPFTETSGTLVNAEGRAQSFNGVVRAPGDVRPAWKVLRVLGTMLDLANFEYDSSEAMRDEIVSAGPDLSARLSNRTSTAPVAPAVAGANGALERIADVPIYFTDAIVRRARSLQKTNDAKPPRALAHGDVLAKFGLKEGDSVRVKQDAAAVLTVGRDDTLPAGCVRIAAAHASTAPLGGMFGPVTLERA
jgi:NADH-quinone oxidoreductase subunit G